MTAYFWTTEHTFPYSWDVVTTHFWSRYPNPNSGHVFSEDLIECGVDSEGILRTKKLIIKTNKLPWWGKHLFSARKVAVIEETRVDPSRQIMTTYTRNIGLRIFMGTTEKNVYKLRQEMSLNVGGEEDEETLKQSEQQQQATLCQKKVWIESDIVGLRSAIKKFGLDRFKVNCVLASDGLTWAIQRGQLHNFKAATSTLQQQSAMVGNNPGISSPNSMKRSSFINTSNNLPT